MKAIVYERYGPPEVFHLEDIEKPTATGDQVLVKVRAVSVNAPDWRTMRADPFFIRATSGLLKPRNRVLGCDIAGTVEAVGPGVKQFRVGDDVFGDLAHFGYGGFAEYVCPVEKALVRKPAGISFEVAAASPMAGITAIQGLRDHGRVQAGQKVLIVGASGGVGTFAVQIAKSYGAHVTGVDSAHKADIVRAVGADLVLDYARQDFADSGLTYDVIVDVACHRPIRTYRRCLRPGGVCSLMGGSIPRVLFAMAAGPAASVIGDRRVSVPMWKPGNPADMATLARLADDGSITPTVDRVVPLADLPDAFRHFGAQQHRGKVVIGL
jgi:NADPH:quinone reductase-like Zn-dependent oxidoreductase